MDSGKKEEATGIWVILEPIRDGGGLEGQEGAAQGDLGFLGAQGQHIVGDLLKMISAGLLIWLGLGKYISH